LVAQDFAKYPDRARRWKGLRQDSGDPYAFAPLAKAVYESMGIDYRDKTIIFSDALNLDKALGLKKQCDELGFSGKYLRGMLWLLLGITVITASFGIGTYLTNDFTTLSSGYTEKSKALNMVIKIASVDQKPCVKISDDLDKASCLLF
jgi:nicotinate phosphoribosyltransferase